MHTNSKSFLMAIAVGTTTLVLAQMYAPNHLKPLTNRLIIYPGTTPALNLKNGIFQSTFTSSKLISNLPIEAKNSLSKYLPQTASIAMIREDQVGVKTVKPSTKTPAPTPLAPVGYGNNQHPTSAPTPTKTPKPSTPAQDCKYNGSTMECKPLPTKTPSPTPITPAKTPVPTPSTPTKTPAPTPTAQEILDKARQDAYTSTYGTETGRYNYNYATGKAATTSEWNDPKAVIAGTYVAPNGKRYSVNIGTTNAAGNDLMNKVSSSIATLSDQEILDLAKTRNQTNPCSSVDVACQQRIIQATLAQIAKDSFAGNVDPNTIAAITEAQHKNAVAAAKFQTQIKDFMDPTKSLNDLAGCSSHPGECRDLTLEEYLRGIGVDPKDIPGLLEGRQANLTALAKAKQVQQTQINTVNKFLTKSQADLASEYCKGVSADRCDDLLSGGILTAVGISPEDAKKFVTQKQAAITISQYETGNLAIVAGKPVDYQDAYKAAYVLCMSQGRGSAGQNCETKATAEAEKKVAKLTTPIDYEAKYNQGYESCMTGSHGRGDCINFAINFAQTAVKNSTTGAINVPKVEAANLTASCIALGGKNCGTSDAALTTLAAMTGNPELTLATIEAQKLQIKQEQKAYASVVNTLSNLGSYDQVSKDVEDGKTTWIDVQNNLNAQREDGWTNTVIGWNDFTGGRFKRGNDLMMSQYKDCTGDSIWSCQKVDDFSRWTVTKGALIQGGDAAMVVTAVVAAPLAPMMGLGAGAVFGTGVGVAASAQMVGSATDTCELANQGKATKADCNKAIAMASISVVGTGLGVIGEATSLVTKGEAVSNITKAVGTVSQGATASKVIAGVELANDIVSAGTFSTMAVDTCKAAGPESLDCISSIAMAVASGGKLLTTGTNLYTSAANVDQTVGGVSQFSDTALQAAHTISADLFFLSACSKMLDPELAKTSDSVSMCAFGLSGAVQTHVIANLSPAGKPPELTNEKTPLSDVTLTPKDLAEYNLSKENLAKAQKEVEAWTNSYEGTSGKNQKDVLVKLNEAKNNLLSIEQAHANVIARINAESVAATAALVKAQLEVEKWNKSVEGTSGTVQKNALVQLNDAKIALSLAETANKVAMAKAATVNPQAPVPAAPPVAPPQNNQADGAQSQGFLSKVGELLFGKPQAPLQVADRKIVLNEEFKGLVEKLGEIKASRQGESALSGKDPVLVAETRTVEGKQVTQFKFNEKVTERSGMTEAELGKLNTVFAEYQAFSDKNIGFDASKGIRGQQADYLISGLEAFAQHGSTGALFGALPGLGKTEVILPMMTYLHATMTNDPQFVLFPEVKLMRPWLSIDANGKAVKNAEIIAFFEKKFGEGSVLILEPGQVPTAAEVGKARVVVATRDAAFELQSIDTLGGRALREKWANSYKFVDESHWTTNLFENFRRSGKTTKTSEHADYSAFNNAIESIRKFTSINEIIEARKSGNPLDVKLTSDGKTGEYTTEREVKIITELLEKNKSILPDNLKNLKVTESNLAESKKLIDQFVDQNFTQPKVKNFAAELTTINKLADLLASVPGTHYGLTQKGGEYSIAPREQSRPSGRTYSNLVEQMLYNKVGVEILKGVGEMKSSINVNVDKLTVSSGGSETTYARLMLEGKGFAMFTGTPELMAKLYKIAYGIELKVFSASAFETVAIRFTTGDINGIFTSIKEQVQARVKEIANGKNQVYTFMDGKTSNVEMTERLLSNYKEGDKVFIVKASGELVEGKVTGGKFELVKTLDSAESMGLAQEAAGSYVKIYEFGAHTGVDTPNNVDFSRAVGICNGCDQTTFSQGINRVRLDANGNAAPMDIIVLDPSLRSTPKDQLFSEFSKLTAENEAHNLTVAEVNFKEILLKTSVDIIFERLLAKSGDGVLGALRDGGLKAKLEEIQGSWKSINEYNFKLDNTNFTPEQKLARTLEQVQGVMKSVDAAIGTNKSVRAEFETATGGYKDLAIKFSDTQTIKPLGEKPSLSEVVELINNTSVNLKTTTVTFREKGASGETIAVAGQEAVQNLEANQAPTLLQRTQNLIKSVTTTVVAPRSLAVITTSKTFNSFSTEDDDGNILRIFKDSTGKLIFEESNQSVGMSSSREFNITDLDLFPPASQTVATRYNDNIIPNTDYSRNAIKPGHNNAEELQKIIDSDGFTKMGIALTSGDTLVIELLGNDIVINTKTADGKIYSDNPSKEQLAEILVNLGDQLVALARNGEDVPLMSYLTLPKENQPILVTLANFFKSPGSEKAGGITLNPSKIKPPTLSNNKNEELPTDIVETKSIETKTNIEQREIDSNVIEIEISASSTHSKNIDLILSVLGGKKPESASYELTNYNDYPITIIHNQVTRVIEKHQTIKIKAGDNIEYGYQTIKYLGIVKKNEKLIAEYEVTSLATPFNEKTELASIVPELSTIKDTEEFMRGLNLRHNQFLAKLTDRYAKLQILYKNILETVGKNSTISHVDIHKQIFDLTISMRLPDNEITNIQKALADYLRKRDKVVELLDKDKYKTPEDLFEAAFGSRPTGNIEMRHTPYTVEFITTNDIDFALAYHGNEVLTGKNNGLTDDQILSASTLSGMQIVSSTNIDNTEGIFTVSKQDSDIEETERTVIHEHEHAFYELLSIALDIGTDTDAELIGGKAAYKELKMLASSIPSEIKKSLSYRLQLNAKTIYPNAKINVENKLNAIKSMAGKFAFIKRKEAENEVANELIARITETIYQKDGVLKDFVSNASFKSDLLDDISDGYDFFAQALSNNLHLSSFNTSWTDKENSPEAKAIRDQFEEIFSDEEQEIVVGKAIEAYRIMIFKHYTHDEAVALLSTTRLAYWMNVARRVPIVQVEEIIPENNLVKSGTSLGKRLRDSYNKFRSRKPQKESPELKPIKVTNLEPDIDTTSSIAIKNSDSDLVKEVKKIAQNTNTNLFEIPSSQLSDRIDLDQDGEAKGSRSTVSKSTITIDGVEKTVAVKVYLSEEDLGESTKDILSTEVKNHKLALDIFGDKAAKLYGIVVTDDGRVGIITEIIDTASDSFIPTQKTLSDLADIQEKMLNAGYYIKDFGINYLIQKDGSVKLIDFEKLEKISQLIDDKESLREIASENKVTEQEVKSDPVRYILNSSSKYTVNSAYIAVLSIVYEYGLDLPKNLPIRLYKLPGDINFVREIIFYTDNATRPPQVLGQYFELNEYVEAAFKADSNTKSLTIGYYDKSGNYQNYKVERPPLTQIQTEQKYLSDKLAKLPFLDEHYNDPSTSYVGYSADMTKYIGRSNVKKAPSGNISKDGLDKVKANLQTEITRLLMNKRVRNNQEKHDIVTWQTGRFIDLLKQAIDEGDIKTDGDNVLTLQAAQDLILRNIHTLAYQDFVASENTLGDHGVRHLVDHNIKVGEKVLDLAKTKDTHTDKSEQIRAIDYLILHQVMIDHDTGYAMGVVRNRVNVDATKGYDSGHNVLAAKMLRERTQSGTDPLSQLFGSDGVARIHQGIITHDSSAVDITVDRATTVDSAIHLADNTHAFETKLPELLYGYPDSIVAMRLMKAAGEIGDDKLIEEIKLQLIDSIQNNSNIGTDDKIALTNAVSSLSKNSYNFTVGRIMGHDPQITFDDVTGKIVVSVTESEIHQEVVGLFGRDAYDQLAKFIADLLGIKKAEAITRIQNNDLKFDGKSVIIQANIIDPNNPTRVVTKNTNFQDRVRDLTGNNPAFVEYLLKDDNLKDLMKSKEEEIKVKTDQGLEQPFLEELQRQLEELKQARADIARIYLSSPDNQELTKTPTLLDWFKDLFKQSPKSVIIPVKHDMKQLSSNESAYLNIFTPRMKNLQVRYDHVNTSESGYVSSMGRYVGTSKVKSPGTGKVSIKGLEKVRSNVKSEITRLFNNKAKRQNDLKYKEVSWEVNRYIDLFQQAIQDGDIKTSGENAPTLDDIQSVILRNIHTLAYQDFVATENTLGDHGVRHLILHNIHVGEKVLDLSVENKTNSDPVRAIDYLMLHQVMIDHDTGYAVDIVRMGVNRDSALGADSGHNVLAAKILRERTQSGLDPLSRVFGAEGIARIHEAILYHDRHTVDLSVNRATTLDSAVHLADNTHAFESKLPELLYGYPDSIVAMRLLKVAGELNDPELMEQIKQKLIQDIQNNKDIALDDKIALSKAVSTLTPKSYIFTAGRIMGGDPELTYENGKVIVSVTESEIHQDVVQLFDQQSYAQLAKFLEDILKTNKKGVFLEQINGNTKRFEGDTVVIQTLIGKELKNKIKTSFTDQLTDLTANNPEFVNYLNQDDNQKDLMNSLKEKIQARKNPPKSLTTILKTRDFKSLIITLQSGEIRLFTDVMGNLSFAKYEDGESTPSDYSYINSNELSQYLPAINDIENVRRDGEELAQGSYTVEEFGIDQVEINELESDLANIRANRANIIRKYLKIVIPEPEQVITAPPISHKVLDDALEIVVTDDGYIVKSTGKLPVKSHKAFYFDEPKVFPAEGMSLNGTFGYLTLIIGNQVYRLNYEGNLLRITNEVTGIDTLLTDHLVRVDAFAVKFDTNLSNLGLKLGSIFNPDYLVQLNIDRIIYDAQTDTYIGEVSASESDITKAIIIEKIKNQGETDLKLATTKYVAGILYNSTDPDMLELEVVVRTADLLYNYLELATYRGPLTLSNSEQLIGSPVVHWTLVDNHTLDLTKIHTDGDVSIIDHLKAGHVITLEEPTKSTVITQVNQNYIVTIDFKNGSSIKKYKTKSIFQLEDKYFPNAEDFDTKTFQIYIVDKNNVNLHSSSLLDLAISSTPIETYVENRTVFQQWLDQLLGRNPGIVQFPGPTQPRKSYINLPFSNPRYVAFQARDAGYKQTTIEVAINQIPDPYNIFEKIENSITPTTSLDQVTSIVNQIITENSRIPIYTVPFNDKFSIVEIEGIKYGIRPVSDNSFRGYFTEAYRFAEGISAIEADDINSLDRIKSKYTIDEENNRAFEYLDPKRVFLINKNHSPEERMLTPIHELGHEIEGKFASQLTTTEGLLPNTEAMSTLYAIRFGRILEKIFNIQPRSTIANRIKEQEQLYNLVIFGNNNGDLPQNESVSK